MAGTSTTGLRYKRHPHSNSFPFVCSEFVTSTYSSFQYTMQASLEHTLILTNLSNRWDHWRYLLAYEQKFENVFHTRRQASPPRNLHELTRHVCHMRYAMEISMFEAVKGVIALVEKRIARELPDLMEWYLFKLHSTQNVNILSGNIAFPGDPDTVWRAMEIAKALKEKEREAIVKKPTVFARPVRIVRTLLPACMYTIIDTLLLLTTNVLFILCTAGRDARLVFLKSTQPLGLQAGDLRLPHHGPGARVGTLGEGKLIPGG